MDDFLMKKEMYFDKLRNNYDVLQSILNSKDNEGKPILRIILDPSTENELIYADSMFTMFTDLKALVETSSFYSEQPDYENILFIDYMERLIIALKNRDKEEIKKIGIEIKENNSPEYAGELVYGAMRALIYNVDEVLNYLAEKTGFDVYDDIQYAQFQVYFQEANETFNKLSGQPIKTDDFNCEDNESLDYLIRFINSFDQKYKTDFLRQNTK